VLESGPEDIKTVLKLAHKVEVILGDTTKCPKGIKIDNLKEFGGLDEEESQEIIHAITTI
jgi:hypothetical protein